jgi:hypothetical protein
MIKILQNLMYVQMYDIYKIFYQLILLFNNEKTLFFWHQLVI